MNISIPEFFAMASAIFAIFMTGTDHLRLNVVLYAIQTILVGVATATCWLIIKEVHFLFLSLAIVLVNALGISIFLFWVLRKINIFRDGSSYLPVPIAMHMSIILLGVSHFLASRLPAPPGELVVAGSATAGISLLLIGMLFMLVRKTAIGQIIGFLTMENGIYLFTLTQAQGMPMIVELGILLDVLVGVMIAGVITFRIQKNFEHIDITLLKDLTD